MLGILFRFVSGIVMGVPVAIIAYYFLPLIAADTELRHVAYAGLCAGLVGVVRPGLLVKWIAMGVVWRRI